MPRYYLNGKVYNIPDDLSGDFEKDNPSAITSYKRDEDIYDIPVYEKDGFLKSFPNAVPYDANQSSMNTGSVLNDNSAGSPKIPGYDAVGRLYELMERNKPSLNELVKKNSQDKPESVNDRDTFQTPIYENALRVANRMRKEQAMRSEDYGYRPSIVEPIEREKNTFEQEEERRIDELYHPKKVENESDVLENYRNRFVLSIRGGKLDGELAEKRGEVEAKYLQIFTQSPEYQDLLQLGASAEEINEKFYQQYGDAINGELRPYENAIFQEMANRYRGRIQEEFTQLQKQRSTDQLKALAGEVDELSKQAHKNLQRRAPSSGNAMNALMGSRNYTQSSEEERRQVGMLNAAKRLIEQSQEIVAEAGKQGGTNFVAGLGRGLRDNMDWENFTFGLADMADALYLNNALEKYEAGNTLSEAEQKLLEASAVNMAIQGFYSSDLGRGYNAGRVTAESLPFMLEFIANPISGSSNAIAKSLLKFGLRRFGRFGSFAARVAGSTGAALGMTGTTGVPRVASGTMDRLNQNYDYYLDENGDLQVQKTGNVGTLEAMGKSIASTALENQSEMVLNAFRVFRPYLRQLEKSLPGGVNSFMQMVKESRPGQLYREVKNNPTLRELVQRTQFQGFPQEYLEEVYNNFSNIPLGDMTLEEATDFDNNLDIILGLTPTFLAFGMIGVGSMATERYQNRKHMERLFGKMTDEQRKKFEELQRMSKINGNEDIKNFIKITMADPELTQEQKRDEIDYAFAIAKQNAIDEIQEAGTQDRIDAETEDIAGHSDPSTNTYTEAERIYMNDVGEWVKEPGHIVGWQDPEKERFPYWIPEGAEFTPENTRLLRPGEWDAATVKSMPTQEVIDETAAAIREDAVAQAQRESTYSPDIVPYNQLEPGRSSFYDKDGNLYSVGNIDTDTKNFMMLVTSPEGKQIASRPFSEEEYLSILQAQIDAQEIAAQPSSTNQAQTGDVLGSNLVSPSLQPETSQEQVEEAASGIPTDEKGNLLYHRAPVDRTVSSINSEGLEPDEVDAFVQANKDASAKLMRNIKGKAPKMGTNIAQYKKAKQEWQARVDDAQAQVDYWNQVADAIQSQRTQVGDATAEEILSMGEPMDGHELAAQMLATGKLPLLQADFKRETGYKGDEARALFGLFASEANGGMTIEHAGEQLMLADQEAGTNFFDQSDPNAGRNAILDVLSGVRTRGDLTNYIRRNREAMAERERQAEYDAYADWCEREMHMTPEEYEAYQEYVVANNPYEGVAVAELDRIFAEAEEEIQTYLNQQDNGQQGTSENGSSPDSGPSERDEPAGAAGSREAGVSVLPEAQPVLPGQVQGRTEGAASQPGTADDGVRAEEGTVSEGASGGEGIENQINDENNKINVVSSQSNQNDTENEQGEVAGISGESSSLDGENEAATILRTTGHSSTTQDGQGSQSKESLLGELAERASGSNQWIDDITSITSSPIGKGGENETYLSRDGRFAIKVNDFSYLPDNSTNFDSFMNRVDAHNELFPNDAITVLGFTRNSEGRISVVLSQPYISNAREATQEEIDNFLEGMDFYTDMSGNWTDGTFDIADTKPNNVLVDADGNLHFIDVLPYDSRKPGKMLVIPPTRNAFVAPEHEEGENLLDYVERVVKTKEIDDARKEVSANPTDAQKEAGNYRKGHITLDGYDITIENPKGSTRSGVNANGQSWSVTMNNDYGYIRGAEGVDGDHIDVFLSDDPTTGKVYVIDQVNADGSFDEHKVMYGFKSALAAKRAYLANYSPGWKGLGNITKVSKEEFKKWVDSSHRKTKPFAEYKSVKAKGAQNEGKQSAYRSLDDFKAERESIIQETVSDLKDEYAASNLPKTDEELRKEAEELVDYNEESDLYMEVWGRLESFVGTEGMDELEVDARKNGEDRLSLATMIDEIERNEKRGQEESEKIKEQSGPVTKIEDVGEKIGGAKKDRFKEFVEKEKQLQEKPDSFMEELRKLPVSKIFNFNLEALRKDGLSNEAATLIDVIRRIVPSKPRTDWKLKRWVSDVFGLYRFCLTLATAEQGTFGQVLERVTHIKKIGGMYRAAMALGGFDSGLDIGQATLDELGDTAGHYDKEGNWVSIKGQWYVTNAGRYGGIYPDYESAKEALSKFAGENSKPKEKGTEIKFSVYSYKNSGESFITPKGKPNIVVESGFKSSKEALDYLNEHMDELQDKYRNMKDSTSIGFAPNGERKGKDWRGGKDVSAEDFRNTFGFRGVEFGNWANQQERQHALNQAYDAFMDLSEATGISPRGLSLGGELGMAFGARGGGGAAAHYEPGKVVINLTKTQGAGTLAHEWWHAIDNYFSRRRGQALGYNTERKGYKLPIRGGKVERESEEERKEITDAFSDLMKSINASSYGQRSNAYAGLKSSYWKEPTELGARAFAVWVERKLSEKGIVNNFLANNNTIGWESLELTQKYYPYPLESDFESLDVAFDNLFGTIEEKVDEETGNTVLYRDGAGFLSNDDLSDINAPITKILGKSTRTFQQRKAFAERERQRMTQRVQELAEKLHLDNVEIVTEPMTITDRQGKTHHPKGFYNPRAGKIVIVVPNNVNTFDVEQTLLHEAVAHYGLRQLFGEHFDTFLDNVYNNADLEVRRKIVELAKENGWNTRLATEEYLASLAEDTNFEDLNASWWNKIKELFLQMLHKIGFNDFNGGTLSDNELRYILWRSYENLTEPGRYRGILGEAADVVKQNELKVGNYAPVNGNVNQVADARESVKAERIRKLRDSKSVEITGNEIEASDDLKQYKKNALEYGKKLQGEYTNRDTGITIHLQRGRRNGGINEVLQHDYKDIEHLQSIAAIPQIIENSIYIDSRENIDTDKNPDVKEYQYYVCGLKIGNVDYTVRSTVAVDKNGNRYYDHKLTHIEKGKLLDLINDQAAYDNGFGTTPGTKPTTEIFSNYKDKILLSILQTNDEENLLFRESTENEGGQNASDDMNDESPSPISTPTVQAWDKLMNSFGFQFSETSFDHLAAVEEFQKLVEKHSGKEIKSFENVYDQMIALSSKTKNEMEMFDSFVLTPMNKAILKLVGEKPVLKRWSWDKGSLRDLAVYVEAKHGVERNRQMAVEAYVKGFNNESLKFFEDAGLDFDREKYKSDLKEAKKKAGDQAYAASYDKNLQRLADEGYEEKEADEKAKELALKAKERAEDNASEKFRKSVREQLAEQYREKVMADWFKAKKHINGQQNLSWIEKQQMLDEEAGKLGADLSKDYSGLSSIFKDKEKYKDGWNTAALKYVEEYEQSHPKENIDGLWKSIELATDYALQKQYESGLVSKEYVERQKERFDNYVPLRGFADEIAGDVYNYIGNEFYAGGNPVKTAGGRTSEAGNPFGSILNIAYSSMAVGNKNMAKLALYSLVVNHDTGGLAIPGRAWMVRYDELKNNKELSNLLVSPEISNGEETPEWVEAVPQFPEKATSEEITRAMNNFEEAMKVYQKKGDAKPIGKRAKMPYRTLYKERDQHDIPLFIAGDKYVITVTGNPRLAQAMNGLLNPDVNNDPVSVIGKKIQRFMAGAFTAQNASFAVANLSRDTIYANNQAFIRENFRYWWKFTKNQHLGFGDYPQMMKRLHKYRHNQLDMNNKTDRLFKEFMENGGATGYTFINDQDEYAHEIAKQMKKLSGKTPFYITPQGALKLMFDGIEFAGQSAELVNRFAAYKTSREMGRPISRSVRDAKEITVNFNRKGAGMKTAKVNRSTEGKGLIAGFRPIDLVACLSQLGRSHIIFWNANMQGKRRTYLNFKEHPVKTTITLVANNLVLGAVVLPFLNNVVMPALYDLVGWSSGDDDEDYYDALTDWERTKNLCLRLPHGYWLKIPMAPDMSPWLSMGDAIGGSLAGKRELTYSDFAKSLVDVASPISINWSYGNKHFGLNFVPSVAQPYFQNMMNVNFMGNPIYKTPFNARQGFIPEYKMVYRSTSPTLIELSRVSNLVTGGSDIKTSGWADWNPAILQNMISGYTGGWGNTMLSIADLMLNTLKGEETSVAMSQVPFVSRFVISGNKDMQLRRVNSSFYKVKDFINEFEYDRKSLENAIREAGKDGNMLEVAKYQDELNQLFNSARCQKYVKLKAIEKGVKSYEEWLNETPNDEMMQDMVIGLKKEGIEELNR